MRFEEGDCLLFGSESKGLPEGVKFEVKPPAGKADPNTVTVTLTAEKPASGPFRLVGHGHDKDGPPKFTRTARADHTEPTALVELVVIHGPEGQKLHAMQAEVIHRIFARLAQRQVQTSEKESRL